MAEEDIPDPLTEGDGEHLTQANKDAETFVPRIRFGLALLRSLLETAPRPSEDTFVNDLAAIACFARVYRQLRAATLLTMFGYYSEVAPILRGAYEAGALGRYLAKEPEKAEKWLKKAEWIPDRDVRKHFGDDDGAYASWYRFHSGRAHPTARSCLPLLDIPEDASTYALRFPTEYDGELLRDALLEILFTTMWACFALRNAASREDVLPPAWRKNLADFATDVGRVFEQETGHPMDFSHLDRDWAKEQEQWANFVRRLPPADELDRLLDEHLLSVRNIHPDEPNDTNH